MGKGFCCQQLKTVGNCLNIVKKTGSFLMSKHGSDFVAAEANGFHKKGLQSWGGEGCAVQQSQEQG